MRGPVEPGLMPPALDFAFLSWLRRLRDEGMKPAAVQAQMNSSIVSRGSERRSRISARCIFVGGQCDTVDSQGDTSIYTTLRMDKVPLQPVRV